MNAANEVAVESFLNQGIKFLSISKVVEKTLNKTSFCNVNSIKDVIEIDKESRELALDVIKQGSY